MSKKARYFRQLLTDRHEGVVEELAQQILIGFAANQGGQKSDHVLVITASTGSIATADAQKITTCIAVPIP